MSGKGDLLFFAAIGALILLAPKGKSRRTRTTSTTLTDALAVVEESPDRAPAWMVSNETVLLMQVQLNDFREKVMQHARNIRPGALPELFPARPDEGCNNAGALAQDGNFGRCTYSALVTFLELLVRMGDITEEEALGVSEPEHLPSVVSTAAQVNDELDTDPMYSTRMAQWAIDDYGVAQS
jgi:hypothetical protein